MNARLSVLAGAMLLGATLTGCQTGLATAPVASPSSGLKVVAKVPIPGLPAGGKFTYDIGAVDPTTHHYYLADRTNKSLDVIDTGTFAVTQIHGGFAGQFANNNNSGPDGLVVIPGSVVYVGDVNSVKVVDPSAGTVVTTIPIATSGFRTDEGCYDPDDKIVAFANPGDAPPFMTFISSTTNTVLTRHVFADSAGLEACVYDPATKNFFVNNDGTTANPSGELDVIPASSVVAGAPVVSGAFPEGVCQPTGLDLGPNEELVVGCDVPTHHQQITLIMSATTGAILKTIGQVGGSDQVAYDPFFKRFYTASRNMTVTGIVGDALTPVLGAIDATSLNFLGVVTIGSGVHSVATDASNGNVWVPAPPTATEAGGVVVYGKP